MSCRIEKAKGVGFVADPMAKVSSEGVRPAAAMAEDLHDCHRVVVEHGGHIFRWELVGGVADE